MSRAQRLLDLIQVLRRYRYPVSGARLAGEVGISLRTLYRDIETLRSQGAVIDGEPGVGYIMAPGFMLPPLMFSEEEIEALVLGARWVSQRADKPLGQAATDALAKIAVVLPKDLKEKLDTSSLFVGPDEFGDKADTTMIRNAIRREHKLSIQYVDLTGRESLRTIWPIALAFFERVRIIAAWCEKRKDYRHFRTDGIIKLEVIEEQYSRRRLVLLKEWREKEGISPQ